MSKKKAREVTDDEKKAVFHLLISIDKALVGCVFMYLVEGQLPVLYPLASFNNGKFDGSLGGIAFPVGRNTPVSVSFDTEKIISDVREFMEKVKAESRAAGERNE
jgi:hypothetical protein